MTDDRFRVDAAVANLLPPEDAARVGPAEILAGLARAKCLFQGRAIVAALGDAAATGTGVVRLTVDGVEHVTPAELFAEDDACPNCEGDTDRPGENCSMCANWLAGREP